MWPCVDLQRELLYDDADRIESWGPDQELEVERCFAPRLHWVRSGWVPTEGRKMDQEPRVLAVDPRPEGPRKQDKLGALVISGVYRQHAHPKGPRVAWHIVEAQAQESWIDHFCRLLRLLAPRAPPRRRFGLWGACLTSRGLYPSPHPGLTPPHPGLTRRSGRLR